MKNETLTIEKVRCAHRESRQAIVDRLAEFAEIYHTANDEIWLRELVFCIFTANASAKMGLRSVEAVKDSLAHANAAELAAKLRGVHRFPNARAAYIETTRDFLQTDCELRLRDKLHGFQDATARRDWLAQTKQIKGLGYKEASHFLRNIGFRGYAILDKHILNCLHEIGVIESNKAPHNRHKYLEVENLLRRFADEIEIDFDELDLVLWSIKTGEILK